MAWHKNALTGLIFASTFLFDTGLAAQYAWYVSASTTVVGFAWIACAYTLPAQAGVGCIAAALLIGINAVIGAHGGNGQSGAALPTRDIEGDGIFRMWHHAPGHGTFNFINTTALSQEWQNVTVEDSELNLIVRRLPDGRINARTQGMQYMTCMNGQCPAEDDKLFTRSSRFLGKRAPIKIEDIDFSWAEPSGYGSKTQSGVKAAASGAANYVVSQKKGTYNFCSRAVSSNGVTAEVGFNFYGDGYSTNFPPPCK